ncbi:hypothetical protein B0H14DRAFT_2593696 [Mycena olivaceomarginata]|nr:hypothetical protein B0H14DRAFT_2593696 [Mycena olivaceomarginata]
MFEAAETIPSGEIKAYRRFVSVSFSTGYTAVNQSVRLFHPLSGILVTIPFFSVENANAWITSHRYQLYLQHNDSDSSLWDPDKATVNQIRAYRNYMLGDHFLGHLFFDLDNTEAWINLVAFQAYMNTVHGSFNEYRTQNSTPFSSCPPSRAESPPCFIRPRIPCPIFGGSESICPAPPLSTYPTVPSHRNGRKGKEKAATSRLQVTRQEAVDEIIQISSIPSTWTVPRIPAASGRFVQCLDSLKVGNRTLTIDRFIRTEDLDSWGGGSSGHSVGDSEVVGFLPDLTTAIKCRRAHLKCKGVYTCEFIDPSHFESYEPDPAATQALWKAEIDANEREAASAPGIVSR